ncbi:MAG: hypothetical protein ACI93N_001839 [Flavobacteriaceae bacterium]|jgi:hypothetical protein
MPNFQVVAEYPYKRETKSDRERSEKLAKLISLYRVSFDEEKQQFFVGASIVAEKI